MGNCVAGRRGRRGAMRKRGLDKCCPRSGFARLSWRRGLNVETTNSLFGLLLFSVAYLYSFNLEIALTDYTLFR